MRSFVAVAVLATVACGGTRPVGDDGTDPGGDRPGKPEPVRHLAIEIAEPEQDGAQTRIDLVTTDETGASERIEIGSFAGTCADTSAAHRRDAMAPILSVDCTELVLRFVHRGSQLIVLRGRVFEGEEPSLDEHTRIPLPSDVPVKTDFD